MIEEASTFMSEQSKLVERYWEKWEKERDPDAGDMLVREYTPLVTYHVQRIRSRVPRTVQYDDLYSLGLQGLFDALMKFERSRDLKFETYASFRIRGAIIDGLRKEDWLSRTSRERTKRVEQATQALEQQEMRHVEPEEVAAHLNVSVDEVYDAMRERYYANILSIDEKVNQDDDDEGGHVQMIENDRAVNPESQIVMSELIQELTQHIEKLNKNEQIVLNLFYTDDMTLTEIGEILNLSTSRISQIHSKALFKLRKLLAPEVMDGGIL